MYHRERISSSRATLKMPPVKHFIFTKISNFPEHTKSVDNEKNLINSVVIIKCSMLKIYLFLCRLRNGLSRPICARVNSLPFL